MRFLACLGIAISVFLSLSLHASAEYPNITQNQKWSVRIGNWHPSRNISWAGESETPASLLVTVANDTNTQQSAYDLDPRAEETITGTNVLTLTFATMGNDSFLTARIDPRCALEFRLDRMHNFTTVRPYSALGTPTLYATLDRGDNWESIAYWPGTHGLEGPLAYGLSSGEIVIQTKKSYPLDPTAWCATYTWQVPANHRPVTISSATTTSGSTVSRVDIYGQGLLQDTVGAYQLFYISTSGEEHLLTNSVPPGGRPDYFWKDNHIRVLTLKDLSTGGKIILSLGPRQAETAITVFSLAQRLFLPIIGRFTS